VSLRPEQLPAALKRGLASVYLVSGDEPLLAGEAADSIRAAARAGGHVDRSVFFIDKSFAWEDFHQATHSLSLFADRRLFELRIASAKPDKEQLLEIVQKPPPDAICLIICGKLDKKAADAPWVRAIEKNGAWVVVRPVDTDALPAWLQARARALRLEIEPAAAQLIVDRVEGNLLAACLAVANASPWIWCSGRSATAPASMYIRWRRPPPPAMRLGLCTFFRD
jgi:DNA polymerase-3 subunit delta